jgi:hypothetical protein
MLQERLARFGKLAACRLVMDKGTRKLKGTAFVEFEQQESAEKAVAACAKARHVFLCGSSHCWWLTSTKEKCAEDARRSLQGWAGPAGAGEGRAGGGGPGAESAGRAQPGRRQGR